MKDEGTGFFREDAYFPLSPANHLSMASLSKRHLLPILTAGIFPAAAYFKMLISCNLRYFATSFVVIISAMVYSFSLLSVNPSDSIFQFDYYNNTRFEEINKKKLKKCAKHNSRGSWEPLLLTSREAHFMVQY
jgi:hypothetical protein